MRAARAPLRPKTVDVSTFRGEGERAFDIYSRLLKDRIIFLGTHRSRSALTAIAY